MMRVLEGLSWVDRRRRWAAVVAEDARLASEGAHILTTFPDNVEPSQLRTGWGMQWWLGGVAAVQTGANRLDWDILVDCLGSGYQGGVRRFAAGLTCLSPARGAPVYLPCSFNFAGVQHQLRDAVKTLASARGAKVLIYCRQGEYRSAAVAVLLICALGGLSVDRALFMVRDSRPQALPPNKRGLDDVARVRTLWADGFVELRAAAAEGAGAGGRGGRGGVREA